MDSLVPPDASAVRSTWFDADNDGSRDLLVSFTNDPEGPFNWKTRLVKNTKTNGNWLEIKLIGPPGNRQSIGGRILVAYGDRVQQQQVGESEGSRFSQGHYRLYFGFGESSKAESIKVFWPDGTIRKLEDVPLNQIMTIGY